MGLHYTDPFPWRIGARLATLMWFRCNIDDGVYGRKFQEFRPKFER